MPLAREQLQADADMELAAQCACATPRWGWIYFSVGLVVAGLAAWYFTAHYFPLTFSVLGLVLLVIAVVRRERETIFIDANMIAIATIYNWKRHENEDLYTYSVRYQFVAQDGRMYIGKGWSRSELPREGKCIPVLYLPENPEKSIPMASFRYYEFSYDGSL
jgi:hypothetical protein